MFWFVLQLVLDFLVNPDEASFIIPSLDLIPVVPHKAAAEVSRIDNNRAELL